MGRRCYHADRENQAAADCLDRATADFRETLEYNRQARLRKAITDIRAGGHTRNYERRDTYDGHGRPLTTGYPSGLTVTYGYNDRGYLATVSDTTTATAKVPQRYDTLNAYGQATAATYGNGVTSA